jgi:HD-GYP domain-containing protein (c-di-GMP phosphodiesterase class II)
MSEQQEKDYYADNLAEVSKDNKVVATQNIVNDRGALIAPAGTEITPMVASKIGRYKLAEQLEKQVSISQYCNCKDDLRATIEDPDIQKMLANEELYSQYQHECRSLTKYPMIYQKLTVLARQLPDVYQGTLLGAYYCLVICNNLEFDAIRTHNVFLAAISRDLGLLHINPEIVRRIGKLEDQERRLLQGHTVIGYQFLKFVPNISEIVSRSVLEHHERTDGFGYPKQKVEAELCQEGQIVALADSMIGLFRKYVSRYGYSPYAIITIMKMHSGVYMHVNSLAAIRFMQSQITKQSLRHKPAEMQTFLEEVAQRRIHIVDWFQNAVRLNNAFRTCSLSDHNQARRIKQTTQLINNIQSMLISSGITEPSIDQWIETIDVTKVSEQELVEIEQLALMLNEAAWQFKLLMRTFGTILYNLNNKQQKEDCMATYEVLQALIEFFAEEVA